VCVSGLFFSNRKALGMMRWEGVGRMGGEGGAMGRREMEREEVGEVGEVM
jgi:hypothetical protein